MCVYLYFVLLLHFSNQIYLFYSRARSDQTEIDPVQLRPGIEAALWFSGNDSTRNVPPGKLWLLEELHRQSGVQHQHA